jgi:ribosomal protein L36
MDHPIFLYLGRSCQIVKRHSDTLIEIINPASGRRKAVPARDVVTVSHRDYYGGRRRG